jgi:acetoacetyl-CoA synthetase
MNPILWTPKQANSSQLFLFSEMISEKYKIRFSDYKSFHSWTVQNSELFWIEFLQFANFSYEGSTTPAIQRNSLFEKTKWFPNLSINFAENILKNKKKLSEDNLESICIVSCREDGSSYQVTNREFLSKTLKLKKYLKKIGINKGDTVVACTPNIPETIYFMLAATSLGAVFSSSSPDFGNSAILDRFSQINPTLLLVSDCYFYKGKLIPKLEDFYILSKNLPTLKNTLVISFTDEMPNLSKYDGFLNFSDALAESEDDFIFEKFSFSHPVFTMYSSGTTGLPKCIVQGTGVLLNHIKEHLLHVNLNNKDRLFYFTTCGWMMWNWMVSSLFIGSSLLLYEGNPFYPNSETLWKLVDDYQINIFGTSAGYLSALEKSGFKPISKYSLSSLKTILSTGSPLLPDQFDFVYTCISNDIQLSSISGGTDLNGCFVLGNPLEPVRRGEIQGSGLGMEIEIWNEDGIRVIEEEGELVCKNPFPSMPLYFGNDPEGRKYHDSYFNKYKNIWRHGDFGIQKSSEGFVLLGRSDATLNPGGVRIGTADIYRIVEKIDSILDSLAIGITLQSDEKIILFVKLDSGLNLELPLKNKISSTIKNLASPRHVPFKIFQVDEIPYTRNMKKVELIVKNLLEGKKITNRESLHNPEILNQYSNLKDEIFLD